MRATLIHGAGDVRVETVPDAALVEPTDAVVRVVRSAICGSDLWPYGSAPADDAGAAIGHELTAGRGTRRVLEAVGTEAALEMALGAARDGGTVSRVGVPQYEHGPIGFAAMFGRNLTLTGGPAPARAYIETLLPDLLDGRVEPGKVFDRTVALDQVPDGYRAMTDREALKVLVTP